MFLLSPSWLTRLVPLLGLNFWAILIVSRRKEIILSGVAVFGEWDLGMQLRHEFMLTRWGWSMFHTEFRFRWWKLFWQNSCDLALDPSRGQNGAKRDSLSYLILS